MSTNNPAVRKNSAFKYNPLGLIASGISSVGKFAVNGVKGTLTGISRPLVVGTNNQSVLAVAKAVSTTPLKFPNNFGVAAPARESGTSSAPTGVSGETTPQNFKFNLPPHAWSIPVRPVEVNSLNQQKTITELGSDIAFFAPNMEAQVEAFHGMRRGRIWRYQGLNYDIGNTDGATTSFKDNKVAKDEKWGFQFLWNPESINISVNLNMDITPSSNDIFRTMLGAYPGTESISLSVVLDRTNDFACLKAVSTENLSYFSKYYLNRYPQELSQDATQQIKDLMALGTAADLEYLFKALNGDNGTLNRNLLGRKTADTGFIQPALIALQLGPSENSLSYAGWVENVSVNHITFTETMIPIRTVVNFSMRTVTGGLAGQTEQNQ